MKWLDRQITNHWLRMNVRAFLWLTLAFSAVNVLLLIAYSVMGDGASITKSSFYDLLLFYVKILVIPLPVINLIYLVQHKKQFANVSVWYLTGLKFLALFTGIAIGTVISFGVEEFLREWSLITDPNLTVTIQSYQLSPLASNLFSYGVIGVIIALPVFIQQARKQEIDAKLNRQELQVIRLKQMKSRAELQTLQAKINPHFLYNSLNSIASLIHDNPDKAEEMVLSLSELFRYSTNSQGKSFSSVKEEVKMVQTYIDVEKVRFGENLNFVLHLGDGVENYFIPRFLIQPLVENAVKHGTSKVKNGAIELAIKKEENGLKIIVSDNGPEFPPDISEGYGLKSTQEKLQLLFPDEYSIEIENTPNKQINIFINELLDHEPIL